MRAADITLARGEAATLLRGLAVTDRVAGSTAQHTMTNLTHANNETIACYCSLALVPHAGGHKLARALAFSVLLGRVRSSRVVVASAPLPAGTARSPSLGPHGQRCRRRSVPCRGGRCAA
jgi:hypothetical protein